MTRSLARRPACLLLALAAIVPPAFAQDAIKRTTPPESAVDAVFTRYDSKTTPGCSVAVIDDGKLLLKKSYGMADPSLGVPRTSATSHWIPYSAARVFVALAVAMQARDGKFGLDDPIRKHIPQVPAYASAVTVRQLLHHTSGLADYLVLDPAGDSMWTRVSEDEFFRVLARWNKLGFAPGTAKMYSNTDYALLEMLVERSSGGSLHDYLHAKLLKPLGMADTRIGANQASVYPGHTLFHYHNGDHWLRVFPYRSSPVGGISVTTNLDDLIRWDAALRDPASGLASMLKELEKGAPPETGLDAEGSPSDAKGYSFGVYQRSYQGLPLVEYHGISGYHYLTQVPGTQLSVATLCNTQSGMDYFGAEVARLYAAPAATGRSSSATKAPPPKLGPAIDVPLIELQRYVGEYRNSRGLFTIALAGNKLVVTPPGGTAFPPLISLGDGKFRQDFADSTTYLLTFKPGDDGDMAFSSWDVTLNESGGEDLRRVTPPAWATTEAFATYAGTYVGDDVDNFMFVRVDGNRVLVASRGLAESALTPGRTRDQFAKWDIYTPRFERAADGRVVALVLDAVRVKGIRFTKR